MLEDAVPETVTDDIGRRASHRQGSRRPEPPGLLVPNIEGFTADIGDRIVVPRCEAESMAILLPRVGTAAFRNERAEGRIAQNIHPWRGRDLARWQQDHVFAPIARKAAKPVKEGQ